MTTAPNLKKEPERLKIKTKDDEIKELRLKTEKHDHEIYWNHLNLITNII